MSNHHDQEFAETAEILTKAFSLFDRPPYEVGAARDRARLMVAAAQASATLQLVREQRIANLLAAAYAPETLQVDPGLTREAYQAAVGLLALVEDEDPEPPMTPEQFADLFDQPGTDPADKDVEK